MLKIYNKFKPFLTLEIHRSYFYWVFLSEDKDIACNGGQNLCCMRQPSSENEDSTHDSNFSTPASSISSTKTDNEKRHLIRPAKNSTLEECLMTASPQNNIGGGDQLQVAQMLYQKFQPSSADVQTEFLTPRISKLGLLGTTDEEADDDGGSCGGSTSPRSHSGKMKKRVSFKLPEAADIIIFYSPKETFEEYRLNQ